MNNKLIFTSYGLTTAIGRKLIAKEFKDCDLTEKKIFLFHEPHYSIEAMLVEVCLNLGFKKENIILSGQKKIIKMFWSAIFITVQKGTHLKYCPY